MSELAIDELYELLNQQLLVRERALVKMELVGPSGLAIRIDGESCLTSISVWPNGYCDVDYLYAATENGEFKHFEFQSAQEAASRTLQEIRVAIERAK